MILHSIGHPFRHISRKAVLINFKWVFFKIKLVLKCFSGWFADCKHGHCKRNGLLSKSKFCSSWFGSSQLLSELGKKGQNFRLWNVQGNKSKLNLLRDENCRTECSRKVKFRVDMVRTIHNDLLTQWRHIPNCQFHTNTFLIWTTFNYLWASEVLKNQSFKSQLFSSSHSPS